MASTTNLVCSSLKDIIAFSYLPRETYILVVGTEKLTSSVCAAHLKSLQYQGEYHCVGTKSTIYMYIPNEYLPFVPVTCVDSGNLAIEVLTKEPLKYSLIFYNFLDSEMHAIDFILGLQEKQIFEGKSPVIGKHPKRIPKSSSSNLLFSHVKRRWS
jgi:hypothetical protein